MSRAAGVRLGILGIWLLLLVSGCYQVEQGSGRPEPNVIILSVQSKSGDTIYFDRRRDLSGRSGGFFQDEEIRGIARSGDTLRIPVDSVQSFTYRDSAFSFVRLVVVGIVILTVIGTVVFLSSFPGVR